MVLIPKPSAIPAADTDNPVKYTVYQPKGNDGKTIYS